MIFKMSVVEISIRKMLTKYSSCTHPGRVQQCERLLKFLVRVKGVLASARECSLCSTRLRVLLILRKKSMTICLKQNIKAKIFEV